MNKTIDKYLIVIWQMLLAVSFTIPLFVGSHLFFPFISTKSFLFKVFIELALLVCAILVFRGKIGLPKKSNILWAVLIYTGVMTIASVFGVDLYRSFWSSIERSDGLLLLYHLVAFFIMLPMAFGSDLVKDRSLDKILLISGIAFLVFGFPMAIFVNLYFGFFAVFGLTMVALSRTTGWNVIFAVTGSISFVVAIYALFQKLGLSFVLASSGGDRLTSTIGNASFLAEYLLFHVFLFLWATVKSKVFWQRIVFGILALFETYILFSTQTRGAFVGLIMGLFVLLTIGIYKSFKGNSVLLKRATAGSFALLLIFTVGIFLIKDSNLIQNNATLRRITSINTTDTTARNRLAIWKASIEAFKDKPILGYGYENYNVGFNKYFPAIIFDDLGSQIWFDRAHNIIFDQLVPGGILGLLAYLSILYFSINIIWKEFKKKNIITAGFLTAILTSYVFQNLFVFDTPSTYILAFALFGYFYNLDTVDKPSLPKEYELEPLGIGISVLLVIGMLFFWNWVPFKSHNNLALAGAYEQGVTSDGSKLDQAEAQIQAADYYVKASQSNTYSRIEARQKFTEFLLVRSSAIPQAQVMEYFVSAINFMKQNIEEQPDNAFQYIQLMSLLNRSAVFDNSRSTEVVTLSKKAIELSPTRPHIYYELGRAYLALENNEEAIKAFQTAANLNTATFESQWNLALAYALVGDTESSNNKINEIIKSGFASRITAVYYNFLGQANVQAGSNANAEIYYRKAIELDKNVWQYWLNYGTSLYRQGKVAPAIEAINVIKVLSPDLAEQVDELAQKMRAGEPF